ncbi:MAG: PAQR family membrane homeostasis protein TrhA [Candidatus Sumerlaeaceae bacterium]
MPTALREFIRPTGPRHGLNECRREEALNCATHVFGAALSLVALWLVLRNGAWVDAWHMTGCLVYAAALVLVYVSSASYHGCHDHGWKRRLRTFDHVCIYLLIAGTYTPFMLTLMRGWVGYTVLTAVWALAIVGILIKLGHAGRYDGLSTVAYVLMGWAILPALGEMLHRFPHGAVLWMLAGGLLYTGGVVFYRLDHRVKYFHTVWHLFVLAGSAAQFVAVWKYVLPWQPS